MTSPEPSLAVVFGALIAVGIPLLLAALAALACGREEPGQRRVLAWPPKPARLGCPA